MTGDDTVDTVRLTYAELARHRGVSIGAAKRLAQRHRWLRQIGNDGLSRVSVPATFVTGRQSVDVVVDDVIGHVAADDADDVVQNVAGHTDGLEAVSLDEVLVAFAGIVRDVTADVSRNVAEDVVGHVVLTLKEQLQTERERATRAEIQLSIERDRAEERAREAETHVRDLEKTNRQIDTLTTRLTMAHERADRAEVRAREAETRATQFQEQLQAELIEHRRVIGMLTEQLAARRSWWPFRQLRKKSL